MVLHAASRWPWLRCGHRDIENLESRQKDLLLTTYQSRYTSCYTLTVNVTWDPSATGISVLPANSNYTNANLVSKADFITNTVLNSTRVEQQANREST